MRFYLLLFLITILCWSIPPKQQNIIFVHPTGFKAAPIQSNKLWKAHTRLIAPDKTLEVRYGTIPKNILKNQTKCETNKNCFDMVETVTKSFLKPLSKDGELRYSNFPPDSVREEFHATQGAAIGFDPKPELSTYKKAFTVVIHKKKKFAVYIVLFNKQADLNKWWSQFFHSIKFKKPLVTQNQFGKALKNSIWKCGEFKQTRFRNSSWSVIDISAALAAMGQIKPYQQTYYTINYTKKNSFKATPFRVINMEQGDLTPQKPVTITYDYIIKDKTLTLINPKSKTPLNCTLIRKK